MDSLSQLALCLHDKGIITDEQRDLLIGIAGTVDNTPSGLLVANWLASGGSGADPWTIDAINQLLTNTGLLDGINDGIFQLKTIATAIRDNTAHTHLEFSDNAYYPPFGAGGGTIIRGWRSEDGDAPTPSFPVENYIVAPPTCTEILVTVCGLSAIPAPNSSDASWWFGNEIFRSDSSGYAGHHAYPFQQFEVPYSMWQNFAMCPFMTAGSIEVYFTFMNEVVNA